MSGTTVVEPPSRGQVGFGGLVPCTAVAHGESAMVAVLAVEHHAEGLAVPLLVLSQAPGMLAWEVEGGLEAGDDVGTQYFVRGLSRQAGLGSLQVTAWLEPAVPPEARRLEIIASGIQRVSSPRAGIGIERPLPDGTWELSVELVPDRTAMPVPDEPGTASLGPAAPRVPARGMAGFRGLVPVGQARVQSGGAVCIWAVERYQDRAVMTVAVLRGEEGAGLGGTVEVWDDRGGRYHVALLHETSRDGWTEGSLELVPALDPRARVLGVRLAGLEPPGVMDGPFRFGVALPELPE
ncbi:MAG: hypothetical protein IT200_11730 [Thermoleophilia bacterium]|nr:hypothetical protein [Thermoleophilia bacterium]